MADVVISELLCFLRCKLSSVPFRNLILLCKILRENEISDAKSKLFQCSVDWASVRQRYVKRKTTTTKANKAMADLDLIVKPLQAADNDGF